MSERIESNILVFPIVFTEKFISYLRSCASVKMGLKSGETINPVYNYGVMQFWVSDKILHMLVNNEGIMQTLPLDLMPAVIEFKQVKGNIINMGAFLDVRMNLTELNPFIQWEKPVRLENFVRTFGDRLDKNYEKIRQYVVSEQNAYAVSQMWH